MILCWTASTAVLTEVLRVEHTWWNFHSKFSSLCAKMLDLTSLVIKEFGVNLIN